MYRKFELKRPHQIRLNTNLSIPSSVHGYSIGIQYMQKWFLDKFDKDFFKTVFVAGKSVFDDYRKLSKKELLSIEKPAVSINPSLDVDYNRDFVDMYPGGLKNFARRTCTYDKAFFSDYNNNIYLAMHLKLMKINFNFRVRVKTRAQQLDVLDYMKIAFKTGSTHEEFVDIDFHVPKQIMVTIAKDNGFEVINGKVKDIVGFLKYLNANSGLPFMYKLRTINGNDEFFIKAPHLRMHVDCTDYMSIDEGERQGQLDNNFHIEMNAILLLPVPQFYAYYTDHTVELENDLKRELLGLYNLSNIYQIPQTNNKDWGLLISTEWVNDEYYLDNIEFLELLQRPEILKVLEYTNKTGLSPAIFLDVHIYNNFKEIPIEIDWENFSINVKRVLLNKETNIAIYANREYINEQLLIIDKMYDNRIS
jgi:hypothetical protein